MRVRLCLAACLTIVACVHSTKQEGDPAADPGPRSGLVEDEQLRQLSPADRETLCTWWNTTIGGEQRMQSCSSCTGDACIDWDVSVSTQAECVGWLEQITVCEATIRQAEDCAFAQAPDLCASPKACVPLEGC